VVGIAEGNSGGTGWPGVDTRRRLAAYGLTSHLAVGDAERLEFADAFFDLVYSWGGVVYADRDTEIVRL